jgi:hypothetical protein
VKITGYTLAFGLADLASRFLFAKAYAIEFQGSSPSSLWPGGIRLAKLWLNRFFLRFGRHLCTQRGCASGLWCAGDAGHAVDEPPPSPGQAFEGGEAGGTEQVNGQ